MKYIFVVKVRVKAWSIYTHSWYTYNGWKYIPLCEHFNLCKFKFLVKPKDVLSLGKFCSGIRYLSTVKVVDCYIIDDCSYYGLFPVEYDVFPQLTEYFGLPLPFGYIWTKRKSIPSKAIAFILSNIGFDI